ncbi:MAG: LEA type 2 family protein [Gammaproteobacteria bacterium]|nr:LEA type 2 family protein [Gammaproteobacteria bacterium]
MSMRLRNDRARGTLVAGWPVMLLAALLLPACSLLEPEPLEPPAVTLHGLEAEALGINSQVFRARLGLFNPNTVLLKISRAELQLELAGVGAARGRTLGAIEVPPGERVEADIRVTMNLLRDGPALLRLLAGDAGRQGLEYSLNGYVQVQRRGPDRIPISASGQLGLPAAGPAGAMP